MRPLTLTDVERLTRSEEACEAADVAFHMDEDAFRGFYDRTSRPLWAYLSRVTGDSRLADDLLQEAYYRFLRAGAPHESEAHRRQYLFRIGVNLARDHFRRRRTEPLDAGAAVAARGGADASEQAADRIDLHRAMARLSTRERALLWLAYAQGASHEEIAGAMGLKRASIKLLLFRARRRLAGLLGGDRARGGRGTPA